MALWHWQMAAGGWGHASGPICGSLVAWRARLLVTEAKGDSEVSGSAARPAAGGQAHVLAAKLAGVPDTGGRHRGRNALEISLRLPARHSVALRLPAQ